MFSSQTFATATGLNPSIDFLSESKNILALPTSARSEQNMPGLVFVGERQEQVPVRLVIFTGSEEEDSVGSLALLKLLVDLDLAPLLAHDYALFCYLRFPRRAKTYFDSPRWNVHWGKIPLPEELLAFDADGFISIRANDAVGGLQIEASDRTIANEVAWPAVARASRIQPLDAEPVRCIQADEGAWLDSAISDLPSNAFRLAIRTPWVAETENQIAAIGIALKEILLQYRSLRNFAKAL
jgi:hypothetical protein